MLTQVRVLGENFKFVKFSQKRRQKKRKENVNHGAKRALFTHGVLSYSHRSITNTTTHVMALVLIAELTKLCAKKLGVSIHTRLCLVVNTNTSFSVTHNFFRSALKTRAIASVFIVISVVIST